MSVVASQFPSHHRAFPTKLSTAAFRSTSASPRPVSRNIIHLPPSAPASPLPSQLAHTHPNTPGLITLNQPIEAKSLSKQRRVKRNANQKPEPTSTVLSDFQTPAPPLIELSAPPPEPSPKSARRSRHKRTKSGPPGFLNADDIPHASIPGVTEPVPTSSSRRKAKAAAAVQRNQKGSPKSLAAYDSLTSGEDDGSFGSVPSDSEPVSDIRGNQTGRRTKGTKGHERKADSEEGESEEWDMPLEKTGTDVLTWQQTTNPPKPNPKTQCAPYRSAVPPALSPANSNPNLTWQQALFESSPVVKRKSSPAAQPTIQRRSSFDTSSSSRAHPNHPRAQTLPQVEKPSAKGAHLKSKSLIGPGSWGDASGPASRQTPGAFKLPLVDRAGGPMYAGSMFQNSPLAGDLPKPRFGTRA